MSQDYFLRLLEETAQTLTIVNQLRKTGRPNDVIKEVEKVCLTSVGLPLDWVKRSSPEQVMETIRLGAEPHVRFILLGELLIVDAEVSERSGKVSEAIRSQLIAFCLLGESMDLLADDEKAIYQPKLTTLARKLEPLDDDPYIHQKLAVYAGALARTASDGSM